MCVCDMYILPIYIYIVTVGRGKKKKKTRAKPNRLIRIGRSKRFAGVSSAGAPRLLSPIFSIIFAN